MSYSILGPLAAGGVPLPLCSFRVPAGFPSPAADHIEQQISLDEVLNIRAPHVYLASISGDSMQGAGIFDGDLAVVDRSIEAVHGHIVIALLNNEPLCKRLCLRGKDVILLSENPKYPPRYVMDGDELAIWGVIKFVDKDVDYAHRICIRDVVVEAFGKEGTLASMFTLNKALHGRSLR